MAADAAVAAPRSLTWRIAEGSVVGYSIEARVGRSALPSALGIGHAESLGASGIWQIFVDL